MDIAKLRKFLMNWVLPPRGIRILCYLMSRCIRGFSTALTYKRTSERLYVLANGPSLKKDLEKYGDEMMTYDRVGVNFMGTSDIYQEIKPTHYVIADPVFFIDRASLPEAMRKNVDALQDVFVNQTTWPMTLITMGHARGSELAQALSANKNITVLYLSTCVPVPEDIVDFKGWARNRYSPPAQNVINMALYLGIIWRYPQIVLLGADTSFHTMAHVEQETNRLYMMDEHFYGTTRRYLYIDSECKVPRKMSTFLPDVLCTFRWYDKLREFADWAGVKIINASSFSWIDAFERPKTSV